MTWTEANEKCAKLDPDGVATLTSVRSKEENDYVDSLMVPYTRAQWIGGTDKAVEGDWRWVDDNSSLMDGSFTSWSQTSPNGGERDNCLIMLNDATRRWLDFPCDRTFAPAVCAKPI